MLIVSVIPIARGVAKEELSYYSTGTVAPGDIVSIPLRKKNVPALITSVTDVRSKKTEIRKASYALRKITEVHARAPLAPAFMHAVHSATKYFACTTGTLLNVVVPKAILTSPVSQQQRTTDKIKTSHEVRALQDEDETRYAYYKSLARELFAKKQTLFLITPTQTSAEYIYQILKRGIADHAVLLHTGFTHKKQRELWQKTLTATHPLLIVATPVFLSLPRNDIGAIVLEQEHSRYYKTSIRPYADFRTFATFVARAINVPLIFGDILLRLETLKPLQSHDIVPVSQPRMHYQNKVPVTIIDMRAETDTIKKAFHTVSPELKHMIVSLATPSDRCFIFTLRKGLYPLTVCGDCGHLVTCPNCGTPLVVHETEKIKPNNFACHRCNKAESAEKKCEHCDSWNLVPLGVGSQRVALEIKKMLPDTPIFHIDTDTMTPTRIRKVVATWQETPSGVLIGTEAVLSYIGAVSHLAVASMDTLFALPDFRAYERMFYMSLALHKKTTQAFLIQTRNAENSIFTHIQNNAIHSWYQEELAERKKHFYPPFSTLIKITTRAVTTTLPKHIAELEKKLADYEPRTFSAFAPRARGKDVVHTLITVPVDTWPDEKLVTLLQSLSPQHAIQVDPEHLL